MSTVDLEQQQLLIGGSWTGATGGLRLAYRNHPRQREHVREIGGDAQHQYEACIPLGLVTTERGDVERRDHPKRRIEEASRYVDVDRLCLSPQCWCSSTAEGNALTREQQADMLRLVVETAEEVWG